MHRVAVRSIGWLCLFRRRVRQLQFFGKFPKRVHVIVRMLRNSRSWPREAALKAYLNPRDWLPARIEENESMVRLPASRGYVRGMLAGDRADQTLNLFWTESSSCFVHDARPELAFIDKRCRDKLWVVRIEYGPLVISAVAADLGIQHVRPRCGKCRRGQQQQNRKRG